MTVHPKSATCIAAIIPCVGGGVVAVPGSAPASSPATRERAGYELVEDKLKSKSLIEADLTSVSAESFRSGGRSDV
jgi:hypothetical protein